MNKAVPWNVKGVGFDTREVARMAAKKVGVPVGQWLDRVIAERAADMGVNVEEIDPADRLEALAARLAELAESRPDDESEPTVQSDSAQSLGSTNEHERTTRSAPQANRSDTQGETEMTEGGTVRFGDGLLSDEIALRDRPDGGSVFHDGLRRRGDERTTRERLRHTVRHDTDLSGRPQSSTEQASRDYDGAGEVAFGGERPLRNAIGTLAERLTDLESRVARRTVERRDGADSAAMARSGSRFDHLAQRHMDAARDSARLESTYRNLDGRLTALTRRLDDDHRWPAPRTHAEMERIDGRLASILSRLNPPASAVRDDPTTSDRLAQSPEMSRSRGPVFDRVRNPRLREAVADIARRQADLEHSSDPKAALLGESSYASIRQAQAEPRMPGPDREQEFSYGSLDNAFRALSERLEARLEQATKVREATDRSADFGALQSDIAALGQRLEAMQRDGGQEQLARTTEALDGLRKQVATLSQGVAEYTAQASSTSLADAVRDLAGRVEMSKGNGVEAALLAPIEQLGADLRDAIGVLDARGSIEGLDRQLKSIAWNIETLEGRGVSDDELSSVQAQLTQFREEFKVATEAPPYAVRLEAELVKLRDKLDGLGSSAETFTAGTDEKIDEIRELLEKRAPDAMIERMDRKLEEVAIRIEKVAGDSPPAGSLAHFEELSKQLEDTHASLAARLAARGTEPSVDLRPLETMVGEVSGKLDGLQSASAEMRTLDTLIRGLMLQIEEARQPTADTKALSALEAQVGRLAERLDRSDQSLTALNSLERAIGDLFQQLEDTRTVALDAAESAARTAAQDTLRAALNNPSLSGKDVQLQTGLVVEQVSQELSEFRRSQDESEKRVHGTLKALSATLERLVDRMLADSAGRSKKAAPASLPLPEAKPEPLPLATATEVPAAAPDSTAELTLRDGALRKSATPDLDRGLNDPELSGNIPPIRRPAPSVEIGRAPSEAAADVTPLIAAARRAAQAAQASAASTVRPKVEADRDRSTGEKISGHFAQKRRPLLLGLAGVILLLGALQIARLTNVFHSEPAPTETAAPAGNEKPQSKSELDTGAGQNDQQASAVAPAPVTNPISAPPGAPARVDSSQAKVDSAPAALVASADDPSLKGISTSLRDLALHGDPGAEYEVAVRLADGRSVVRDVKAATTWFERAAKQGSAPAQYRLGSMYEKGLGVTADPAAAMKWYEQAATLGNIRAMHNLAVMAADGNGGKPDYAKAANWFSKAANAGVRDSQYNLGILYARGLGVPQSLAQSYTWFSVAASQGDVDAAHKRDDVGAKLDAKAMADAKTAADTFKAAAPDKVANEVTSPAGGWDVASPAKPSSAGTSADLKARANNT